MLALQLEQLKPLGLAQRQQAEVRLARAAQLVWMPILLVLVLVLVLAVAVAVAAAVA